MNDSIDRVFGKGIATVRALSSCGLPRPPAQVRAQLYGLYKQATEGDVAGLVERPDDLVEQAKWDAWRAVEGLCKSEAKQRYIALLIETMKPYTANAEARELILELEEMWEQLQQHTSQLQSVASSSQQPQGLGIFSLPQSPQVRPQSPKSTRPSKPRVASRAQSAQGPLEERAPHAAHAAHETPRAARAAEKSGDLMRRKYVEEDGEWRREVARAMEALNEQVLTLRSQVSELSNEHLRHSGYLRHRLERWVRWAARVCLIVARHVTIDLVVVLVGVALARVLRRQSPYVVQRIPGVPWLLSQAIVLLDHLRANLVYY